MKKIVTFALLLISFLGLPVSGMSGEVLQQISEKKDIRGMYERAVDFFTRKMPGEIERRRNNSVKYIDFIKTIFGEKGIPDEMVYIPFIESGFSPVSVGAGDTAGLWQFMKCTAVRYGLRIDAYVDERKDPIKSTYAAAEYLRDLHSIFGEWDIVLAAYNAGEGKIRRIIAKNNADEARLPDVINRYIARLLAVFTIAEEPEKYGFAPDETTQTDPVTYKEITTMARITLGKIARLYGTTVIVIKDLNPALIGDATPPYHYVIRVPVNY